MSKITVLGTLSQYFTTGLSNEIFQTGLSCGTEEVLLVEEHTTRYLILVRSTQPPNPKVKARRSSKSTGRGTGGSTNGLVRAAQLALIA